MAGINPKVFFAIIFNCKKHCVKKLNPRMNTKKVSSASKACYIQGAAVGTPSAVTSRKGGGWDRCIF